MALEVKQGIYEAEKRLGEYGLADKVYVEDVGPDSAVAKLKKQVSEDELKNIKLSLFYAIIVERSRRYNQTPEKSGEDILKQSTFFIDPEGYVKYLPKNQD